MARNAKPMGPKAWGLTEKKGAIHAARAISVALTVTLQALRKSLPKKFEAKAVQTALEDAVNAHLMPVLVKWDQEYGSHAAGPRGKAVTWVEDEVAHRFKIEGGSAELRKQLEVAPAPEPSA